MNRRTFIGSILLSSISTKAMSSYLTVLPNDDIALRSDIYARMAKNGPYPEAEAAVAINLDEGNVPVIIYVSKEVSSASLVIFSHGHMAEPQVYLPLMKFLTTHGYCVVAPLHQDTPLIGSSPSSKGDLISSSEIRDIERRAYQCRVARDNFSIVANTMGVAVNANNPIIIGHDRGATVAQLLVSSKIPHSGGILQYPNDWWAGAALIDPVQLGSTDNTDNLWEDVTAPLAILSSSDQKTADRLNDDPRLHSYFEAPEPYKHLAYFRKAKRTSFSGQSARPNTEEYFIFMDIKATLNSFLTAYGKRGQDALEGLYNGELVRSSYGYADISSR